MDTSTPGMKLRFAPQRRSEFLAPELVNVYEVDGKGNLLLDQNGTPVPKEEATSSRVFEQQDKGEKSLPPDLWEAVPEQR